MPRRPRFGAVAPYPYAMAQHVAPPSGGWSGLDVLFAILAVLSVLGAVGAGIYFGLFHNKDTAKAKDALGGATTAPAPPGTPPPGAPPAPGAPPPTPVGAGASGSGKTCGTKLSGKVSGGPAWGQPAGKSVKGRKVALVGSFVDGSDACTDASVQRVVAANKDKLFQSVYKMRSEDTDTSVYYLSQFVDHALPAALTDADRLSYKTFVEKKAGKGQFESAVAVTTGLECELITGADLSTKEKVETACANDDRCAGYYTSGTAGLHPVMALASRGNCTLSWMKLASADLPTETDVCRKFLGDTAWAQKHNGWCFPNACDHSSSTWGGMCKDCPPGWGKCDNCTAKATCVPLTEDTCPVGWALYRGDSDYPGGVCKPVCDGPGQKGAVREWDGFCADYTEANLSCADGYGKSYHGTVGYNSAPWINYCRPGSGAIKAKYYKT